MEQIKVCPFCECDNAHVDQNDKYGFYYVICWVCDARGPYDKTEDRAIHNWNKALRYGPSKSSTS